MSEDAPTYRTGLGTRPRRERISVWLTPDEKAVVERRAEQSGLGMSGFLRAAGMGAPLHSAYDYQVVQDLLRVAGDQGRLAGLLKLWLAERRDQVPVAEMNKLLADLRAFRDELRKLARRV